MRCRSAKSRSGAMSADDGVAVGIAGEQQMQRRYITVDVFTDRAFGGNPLAVVLDAGGLSTAQMQAIAVGVQLFRDHLRAAAARYRPRRAGTHLHACAPKSRSRAIPMSAPPSCWRRRRAKPPARLRFEEGAGLVPVEILQEEGRVVGAELTAPQPLKQADCRFSAEQAAACLSLSMPPISGPTGIRRKSSRSGCRS